MKRFFTVTLTAIMAFTAIATNAQQSVVTKKAYFKNYPSIVKCKETELSKVFNVTQGRNHTVSFSNTFNLSGTVISNVMKYKNLQCITMKLPEYGDAVLGLSKRIDENNNIIYSGRIINPKGSDAYELKKNSSGEYELVKIELSKILQDCSHP